MDRVGVEPTTSTTEAVLGYSLPYIEKRSYWKDKKTAQSHNQF
jgi:hypothetical protein